MIKAGIAVPNDAEKELVEANVEGEEVVTVKEDDDPTAYTVKAVTPLALNVRKPDLNVDNDDKDIASLTFLCVDGYDKFFTISRNFIVEEDEEKEKLEELDLNMDNMGINTKICAKQIINRSPCYVSEFNFESEGLDKNYMYLPAIESTTGKSVKFKIGIDSFLAMSYIEEMVYQCEVGSDIFFNLCTINGSKEDYSAEYCIIDKIKSVDAMCNGIRKPIERIAAVKYFVTNPATNELAIVVTAESNTSATEGEIVQETYSIMMPYVSEEKYKKDKFKGLDIETMESTYFGKPDQYSSTLFINDLPIGDKEYNVIRTKNSDGVTKVFLLSTEVFMSIENLVKNY